MPTMARAGFAAGWVPDADVLGAPTNALLRMDNLVQDELGAITLRKGSAPINGTPLSDLDVHSLYTTTIDGTRVRMAGAGASVYANGTTLGLTMAGTDDVAFGQAQGHVFFARSTSKHSYDGTTARQWGIPMTGGTAVPRSSSDGERLTLATCNNGESPGFTAEEGTLAQATGYDGTANGAVQLTAAATGRATAVKTFATDLDTLTFASGAEGNADDWIEAWVYLTEPTAVTNLTLQVDVNRSSATQFSDYYYATLLGTAETTTPENASSENSWIADDYRVEGYDREALQERASDHAATQTNATPILTASGWTRLLTRRSAFARVGATTGCGWETVCKLRVLASVNVTSATVRVDAVSVLHGPLSGTYTYRYVLARTAESYTALSAPSDISAEIVLDGTSAFVQVPPDADRSSDVTDVWLYRMGGNLDAYYRVGTVSLVSQPFGLTAEWELTSVPADLPLTGGVSNATGVDDLDADVDLTIYGVSNHTSADEDTYLYLADCGASTTLVLSTGGVGISDVLSDKDALITDLPMETDNTTPPDGIVGIAGPYYDRLFTLTPTELWPSRRLNPESFATGQAITVGSAEEVAYWVVQGHGGLYVGTSRDIYRIDGTLAELPDGTIEVTKTPLNIDHPPIGPAVAKDGPLVVYLAHDGWRALSGSSGVPLVGVTSLLYRGHDRHGLEAVNLTTGRVRCAITQGQLVAITPEGADTISSAVMYRAVLGTSRWYRHTYPVDWRSVAREPDGTLIAGDTAGTVWTLDTGTDDDGADIPVVLWTKADDDGQPFAPKAAAEAILTLDTGGDTATVGVYSDGSATVATSASVVANGRSTANVRLTGVSQWLGLQLRITGSFTTFVFGGYLVTYRAVPVGVTTWDSGPMDLGTGERVWLRDVRAKIRAGADVTVTPYFDGVAWPAVTMAVGTNADLTTILEASLGRGYVGLTPRVVLTSTEPFFPYWVELRKRSTAAQTDKQAVRINTGLGGETAA